MENDKPHNPHRRVFLYLAGSTVGIQYNILLRRLRYFRLQPAFKSEILYHISDNPSRPDNVWSTVPEHIEQQLQYLSSRIRIHKTVYVGIPAVSILRDVPVLCLYRNVVTEPRPHHPDNRRVLGVRCYPLRIIDLAGTSAGDVECCRRYCVCKSCRDLLYDLPSVTSMRKQNEFTFKFPGGGVHFPFNDLRKYNRNRMVIAMRNERDNRPFMERITVRDALEKFG